LSFLKEKNMKTKLLAIIAFFSMMSVAQAAQTIATYKFAFVNSSQVAGVPPTGSGLPTFNPNSVRVTAVLKKNRVLRLKIQRVQGSGEGTPVGRQKVIRKRLRINQFNDLFHKVTQLSTAEIEEHHSDIICMMLPYPSLANDHLKVRRNYDYGTYSFGGPIKLVSSPSGCWLADKTFPKNEGDKNTALSLKSALKSIALGFVER
jgi:hypothetical protein